MWHAACELCRQSQFLPDAVTAFTVRNKAIEFVALNGKDPWSGVRVICDACIREFRPILESRVAVLNSRVAELERELAACRPAADPAPIREPILITRIAYPETNYRPPDNPGTEG